LQRHLDGEPLDALALERHLRQCPVCQELYAASQRLREGLQQLPAPVPPAGLAGQITRRLLADRRRALRIRLVTAATAVAAGLLVAIGTVLYVPRARTPVEQPGPAVVQAAPSLQEQVGEVGLAVASLARRAADETLTTTRSLLPEVPLPAPREATDAPARAPDSEKTLREVQKGVSAGIEPVTTSARRAFGMFVRDWSPNKQDSKSKN
jgi:hypothetical protein